jgi:TM2 domain-containing membrane protein YozV
MSEQDRPREREQSRELEAWQAAQLPARVQPKSPAVALIISLLVPGVGSMTVGRTGIGVAILVTWLVGAILSAVIIGIPIALGAWIWGMVDAHHGAVEWNRARGIIS